MKLTLISIGLVALCVGCGGGSGNALQNKGTPVPTATAPPPPAPTPTPVPSPAPAPEPMPVVVGHGQGVRLNITPGGPVVAWSAGDGTHVGSAIYQGFLEDFADGHALTETQTDSSNTLFLDGLEVVSENAVDPPVIATGGAAWITNAGVFLSNAAVNPVYAAPAGADMLEVATSPRHIAYVTELGGCSVYVDGHDIFDDSKGCPMELKFVEAADAEYLGWCDGVGVGVAISLDGFTWNVEQVVSGGLGVVGFDYAVRADGVLYTAWTQEIVGEDGSSVWARDGSTSPLRLSMPVKAGFSGAGNPAVGAPGVVAWLDDAHGSVAGHFDVWLDGVDLSNTDNAIDEMGMGVETDGMRVVVWDDETQVWEELVPPS